VRRNQAQLMPIILKTLNTAMKKIFNTDLPHTNGHVALLIFRVLAAIFMLTHGIPKLQKLLSGDEIEFANPYGRSLPNSSVQCL
jgi:hypothetical protein